MLCCYYSVSSVFYWLTLHHVVRKWGEPGIKLPTLELVENYGTTWSTVTAVLTGIHADWGRLPHNAGCSLCYCPNIPDYHVSTSMLHSWCYAGIIIFSWALPLNPVLHVLCFDPDTFFPSVFANHRRFFFFFIGHSAHETSWPQSPLHSVCAH